MKSTTRLSFVAIALLLTGCAATFVAPKPVYYSDRLSTQEVRAAILKALTKRGWERVGESENVIQASIHRDRNGWAGRSGDGTVDIVYSSNHVSFKANATQPPPSHKSWIENLREDVVAAITNAEAEKK